MPGTKPQSATSHARYVPGYHFVLATLLFVVLAWAIVLVVRFPRWPSLFGLLIAVSLIFIFWYMRAFAVTVQDRIIRLEERLRLGALVASDLQPRIPEFTTAQLIALRFASDGELPALARRVLDEKIADGDAIKKLVTHWRADHLRV
jgi:hypothetical protein